MIHLTTDHDEYFPGYPGDMLVIPADRGYSPIEMAETILGEANTLELSVDQLRQAYRVALSLLWGEDDDSVQAEAWPAILDEDGEPHPSFYHFFGFADEDGEYGWDTVEGEEPEGFPKTVYAIQVLRRPDLPLSVIPGWATIRDELIPGLVQLRLSFYRTHVLALVEKKGGDRD